MGKDKLIRLISLEDAQKKQLSGVIAERTNLVVANDDGQITVFQGSCPHQGTLLAEGEIENGHIVCPAHRWQFDCASGKKKASKKTCLQKFETVIKDGAFHIYEDELANWKNKSAEVRKPEKLRTFSDLPGPKSWPVLGNLPSILSDTMHLHKTLHNWGVEFGPIYRLKGMSGTKGIVISDPKLQREIFMDRPASFRRIKTMESAMEEVGLNGLITAEGDLWKRYRKYATRGLANRLLRKYFETVDRSTKRLNDLFDKNCNKQVEMDIQKDLLRYSVDVTSSLAFGADINTIEHREDTVQEHLALVLPMVQRRMMIPVPYWRYVRMPIDYKLDDSLKIIKKSVTEFMNQARARIEKNPDLVENPSNFLEALLAAQYEDETALTDEEVYTNVFSILLAGEDSTANSIAWAIHYMTENEEVQKKMQAEVDAHFGTKKESATFDELTSLPYIEAVINEALRLRPVLPVVQLCANEDLIVSDVEVSEGTNVHLPMYNVFMDDEYFEKSKSFNPDRWFTEDEKCQKTMKDAFLPFGFGPRVCPGRSLALIEAKAVLTMVCRNFHVSKPKNAKEVDEIFSGVMQPVDLNVVFRRRTDEEKKQAMATASEGAKCPFYNKSVDEVREKQE